MNKKNEIDDEKKYFTSMDIRYDYLVKEGNWGSIASTLKRMFDSWYEDGLLAVKPIKIESCVDNIHHKRFRLNMVFEKTSSMDRCIKNREKKRRKLYTSNQD